MTDIIETAQTQTEVDVVDGSEKVANPAPYNKRFDVRFQATTRASYHGVREAVHDRRHKVAIALALLSGATTLASAFDAIAQTLGLGPSAGQLITAVGSMVVVLATTADLVFDFPGKARLHQELRQQFYGILADLEIVDDDELPRILAKMQQLYAKEPPMFRAAHAIAFNTAVSALFNPEDAEKHYAPISRFQRTFAQIWKFDSALTGS